MKQALEDRFWSKVDSSAGPGACWPWTAARHPRGYGRFGVGKKGVVQSHRLAWELASGAEIPAGFCVLHHCDNPSCVNPKHLFLGTQADNVTDCVSKGRQPRARGARHARTRLSDQDVLAIRGSTETTNAIAARYGISTRHVLYLIRGERWRHLRGRESRRVALYAMEEEEGK